MHINKTASACGVSVAGFVLFLARCWLSLPGILRELDWILGKRIPPFNSVRSSM